MRYRSDALGNQTILSSDDGWCISLLYNEPRQHYPNDDEKKSVVGLFQEIENWNNL